jgi:KUP system potassium uptake protein
MRVDNDGEGGILALMALLGVKREKRPDIVAVGLFRCRAHLRGRRDHSCDFRALRIGGLELATPAVKPYIVPAAVVILIMLFAVQPLGTERIGRTFGPIMAFWFVAIAALGLWGIAQHPAVLAAIDPRHAAVFLCVTGAEALYADMGHFGARPIRLAWSALVFPSLVLNYAGQAGIVLEGAPNVFYRLCPSALLIPFVALVHRFHETNHMRRIQFC